MTVLASQLKENVERSLGSYLQTKYANFSPIQWPGVEFAEGEYAFWIKPDLMFGDGPFFRQVAANGNIGKQHVLMYNINIFVNRSKQDLSGNVRKMIQTCDKLEDFFKETTQIPVKDYVNSNPNTVVGVIDCFKTSVENLGLVANDTLYQRNVTADMRWESKMEVPT